LAFKTLTKFADSFLDPRNVVLDVFFSETTATKEKPMPRACKPREREREREREAKVS
jgi:hypothetical protein